jgi:hypothetical protein
MKRQSLARNLALSRYDSIKDGVMYPNQPHSSSNNPAHEEAYIDVGLAGISTIKIFDPDQSISYTPDPATLKSSKSFCLPKHIFQKSCFFKVFSNGKQS